MRKILVVHKKSICYGSTRYFAQLCVQTLKELEVEASFCDLTGKKEEEILPYIRKYIKEGYDLMIGFNSILPLIKTDDGQSIVEQFEIPFYDYILDHPLYHHDILSLKIPNLNVICLDELHAEYIRTYYPYINKVTCIPIGGMSDRKKDGVELYENQIEGIDQTYQDRPYGIFFPGTYTAPEKIRKKMESVSDGLLQEMSAVLAVMEKEPKITQEEALRRLIKNLGASIGTEQFAQMMNFHFLLDTYLQARNRKKVIQAIVSSGQKLHVVGYGWDQYTGEGKENISVGPVTNFYETFSLMQQSKIVLNILPGFRMGAHDRIYSSMLNGAVCLTDTNPYLNRQFLNGVDYLTYDTENVETIGEILQSVTADKLEKIATNGNQLVAKKHTWRVRMQEFVTIAYTESKKVGI